MLLKPLYVSVLAVAATIVLSPVWAQAAKAPELVDTIVAVVGTEPITAFELHQRVQVVAGQNRMSLSEQLRSRVLDVLINERVQAQAAVALGINVSEVDVDQAEQTVAAQNQLDIADLHQKIKKEGLSVASFRRQLRDQLLVQRVREREVSSRITITPTDINQFLQTRAEPGPLSVQVAHILVPVPEDATDAAVASAKIKAINIQTQAKAGEDFAELAREHSQAADAAQGGDLGLREVANVPPALVTAVASVAAGEVGEIVRTGAGWHVVKLLKRQRAQSVMTVEQARVRHILLRGDGGDAQSQAQAMAKLEAVRAQLLAGEVGFAEAAIQVSQDGSAPIGGDLGWVSPGMLVPEFEAAMSQLDIDAISPVVVSRFGVHLIQVLERARVALTDEEQNTAITNLLREQKTKDLLATWVRDLRARAYVDIRAPRNE